ncbi:MAG: insulinase family protein [Myxococcales bacterium]|nr:insulinase family protein [Myxococcales bacterium]
MDHRFPRTRSRRSLGWLGSLLFSGSLLGGLLAAASAQAQDIASFEKRTTVKVLANGLTLVIVERPEAPVFSYFTHVDVGGAQEGVGQTGMAHMFEHMAFKGTDRIGTNNFALEKLAVDKVEKAYQAYDAERRKPYGRDAAKLAQLEKDWRAAMEAAEKFVVQNEFGEIVDRVGGTGLNAFTNTDETGYFYSLPSNRVELWAYLESERMKRPVMRQFYQERDVVNEERRMRTDSNPIGRLIEQALAAAYTAHPYGRPVVGWPSDLQTWSASDALKFWETYYVPANMVVGLVGDVKAAQVMPVLESYFGRLPKAAKPAPLGSDEPPQFVERSVTMRAKAQPLYAEVYHRPDYHHPDNAVYNAIADLMSSGPTSRLYRSLVRDQKLAAAAQGAPTFPGSKYPSLFLFFAIPTPGHSAPELRAAIHREIERLKNEPVSDEELKMVKTRAKVNLLRSLENNQGLAIAFAKAQQRYGDWRQVFRNVEEIERVSKEDIRRVASQVFVDSNRTAAWIESTAPSKPAAPAAQKGGTP